MATLIQHNGHAADDGPANPESHPEFSSDYIRLINPDHAHSTAVAAGVNDEVTNLNSPSTLAREVVPSCTLETLPTELRLTILECLPDLSDIQALVHASPVLHQQYLSGRRRILKRFLRKQLGGAVLPDAWAANASSGLYQLKGDRFEDGDVVGVLGRYAELRDCPAVTVVERLSTEELAGVAGFYQAVVRPLVKSFPVLISGSRDLSLESGKQNKKQRARFLGSLYRFEVLCNLLGSKDPQRPASRRSEDQKVFGKFLRIYEMVDVDEINNISLLVRTNYESVLGRLMGDTADKRCPLFRPPWYEVCLDQKRGCPPFCFIKADVVEMKNRITNR